LVTHELHIVNVIFHDLIALTIGKGNVITRRQPMLNSLAV
jgi:hypothetical protein